MLNQLVIAEVQNPMLGNIIVVSGSILLLLFLLKHFAWDAISSMMQKREDKIARDAGTNSSIYNNQRVA